MCIIANVLITVVLFHLNRSQLCINTAIVYMHRFYVFHSFTKYHRNVGLSEFDLQITMTNEHKLHYLLKAIASCALFLAAKVEEQPRKLEHVIKVCHICLHRENPPTDVKTDVSWISV